MNAIQNLKLELSLDDVNIIFSALGKMPFEQVYDLIGKIRMQAEAQLNDSPQQNGSSAKKGA
jgi:hypothetical protein